MKINQIIFAILVGTSLSNSAMATCSDARTEKNCIKSKPSDIGKKQCEEKLGKKKYKAKCAWSQTQENCYMDCSEKDPSGISSMHNISGFKIID